MVDGPWPRVLGQKFVPRCGHAVLRCTRRTSAMDYGPWTMDFFD
jgi:hypothetical protein